MGDAGRRRPGLAQAHLVEPYALGRIVLNDRPNSNDQITGATLVFSDGSTLSTGALPNDGSSLTLDFAARTVTSVQRSVTA